jgi:hypothetical protein
VAEQADIEYHGVNAAQLLTGLSSKSLEHKLGRDATLRRGTNESPLWRVERIRCFRLYGDVMPPDRDCPVLYSGIESARLVGIGRNKFLRIAPFTRAYAVPAIDSDMVFRLWPEPSLLWLRKQISIGAIAVNRRSLTRPKAGVTVCPPRHVHAENIRQESASCRKWQSWTALA